jgi:GWxTD domain-containing protein
MKRILKNLSPLILAGIFSLTGLSVLSASPAPADSLSGSRLVEFAAEAIRNKGWEAANDALKKYLEKNPPTAQILVYLGQAQLRLSDEKDAEKSFLEALKQDKKNTPALDGLLEVYLIRNREKEMMSTLKQYKSLEPESRKVRYYQALAADHFPKQSPGENYFWDTLEQLIREDPNDFQTLNTLCDAYIQDKNYERGILFLTEMNESHGERPEYYFHLARIYSHSGDKELSREILFKIDQAGMDSLSARGRFLMAKELLRLEEPILGCEAYFSAARQMDDEVADEAFSDLRDITTSDEKREFKLTPSGRKGLFLISFWNRKDPTPTTIKNERLIEHYKRMDLVKEKFYSPLKPGYDERGRIYIKHGEPDQKISLSGNWAIRENVSWLYSKGRANPLIYHFVERNNYFRMAYRLEEALIPDIQSEMDMGGNNIVALFRSRGEIHPKYDQLANELTNFQGNIEEARHGSLLDIFADEEMLTERGFTEGEITETFQYDFQEEPMNFYYCPIALKGQDSLSAVGIFFGLPTSQVKLPDPFGTVDVPVELEVVAYDSWWQEVKRVVQRKTYRVNNFISSQDNLIPDLVGMQLSPGYYHLAVRMKQEKSNLMQIYKGNYFVHSYSSPDSLYLSDLIMATDVVEDKTPGKFNIRGHRISPMPSASFKKNQPVFVYYELYNLQPDQEKRKHIKVEYMISSSGGSLSVAEKIIKTLGRFIGTHEEVGKVVTTFERDIDRPGPIDPIYLSIDATLYPPGSYNLMISVEDTVNGKRASRDATFIITK